MILYKKIITFIFLGAIGNAASLLGMEVKKLKTSLKQINQNKEKKKLQTIWSTFVESSLNIEYDTSTIKDLYFVSDTKIIISDKALNLITKKTELSTTNKPFFTRYEIQGDRNPQGYCSFNTPNGNQYYVRKMIRHTIQKNRPDTMKVSWGKYTEGNAKITTNKHTNIENIPLQFDIHLGCCNQNGTLGAVLFKEKNNDLEKIAICSLQPFTIIAILKTVEASDPIENITINQSGTMIMVKSKNQFIQFIPTNIAYELPLNKKPIERFNNTNFAFE
jgi:hypothetical protein